MYPDYFEFQSTMGLIAGPGVISSLGELMERLGVGKALVVTDKVLRSNGLVDKVIAGLQGSTIEVAAIFDDVVVNSEYGVVEKGGEFAKNSGADCMIAVGGGSVIDTAKGMNVIWTMGGKLVDYEGVGSIDQKLKPFVVIPTTAGTGSEVTKFAVIKNDGQRYKTVFAGPFLTPDMAILDPELTVGMPPVLTASTGMDALVHAIEALTSLNNNPICDGLALNAIKLLTANIVTATKNGSDIDARYAMLVGSNLAGMACSTALLGCVHGISHTLGGIVGVPHGIANGMLLPYCMEFNLDAVAGRYADAARAMGIDTGGMSDIEAAQKAVEKVRELIGECDLPSRLSQVGVAEGQLEELAEAAALDASMATNPKEILYEDVYQLLKKIY